MNEQPITRKAADGVNEETIYPDGSCITTLAHVPNRRAYEQEKAEAAKTRKAGVELLNRKSSISSQPVVDDSNYPEIPDSSKPGIDSAVCLLQNRRNEIKAELNKINAALNALGVADDSQKQTD